jgi:hypothetical protein
MLVTHVTVVTARQSNQAWPPTFQLDVKLKHQADVSAYILAPRSIPGHAQHNRGDENTS